MKQLKKSELHHIGHLRGIDQYEVPNDMSLLVLQFGDKYYLSQVSNWETHYNYMIASRITLFYKHMDVTCLGEEIEVVD